MQNFIQTRIIEKFTPEVKDLVLAFFTIFSRYEYALKAANYNNMSNPNWDTFINAIRVNFNTEIVNQDNVKTAFNYFITEPPLLYVFNNGNWSWETRTYQNTPSDLNKVCQSIRDLRNNLFHGAKFQPNHNGTFSERDILLIRHSITILEFWLNLQSAISVKQNFESL